jgi:hypothetical protein
MSIATTKKIRELSHESSSGPDRTPEAQRSGGLVSGFGVNDEVTKENPTNPKARHSECLLRELFPRGVTYVLLFVSFV